MIPEYPKQVARVASVLALIGSLIWVQWPIDLIKFNIAAVVFLIASFASWAAIELADARNNSSLNNGYEIDDINKTNILLGFINRKQYYILKHHNVETYISSDAYRGIEDLLAYKDVDISKFHNEKIQARYIELLKLTSDFLNELWGLYTSDGKGRATWRSNDDGWVAPNIYKEVQEKIGKLNATASKIASTWEELVATARKELKATSPRIDQYDLN